MNWLKRNDNFTKTAEQKGSDDIGDFHRVHIRHNETGKTFQLTQRGEFYSVKHDQSGKSQINTDEGGIMGFIMRAIKGG